MDDSAPLLDRHANQLKAMGHPARLAILRLVVQGPVEGTSVGEIQTKLGIPGSTLNHHLTELAQAGLIKRVRQGTSIHCSACFAALKDLTGYIWDNCCGGGCCGGGCRDANCL
ncbi:MAG TPA: metalloregulator ArsR/SmtB family transcription factor [Holophaga sp.]|jgi:DNA-binding transcriptional ArsR family regulator|nr:metalloregulator ArsR/SmtB family transcription factor [Holophaga sp.]